MTTTNQQEIRDNNEKSNSSNNVTPSGLDLFVHFAIIRHPSGLFLVEAASVN
jgi:hypothetical protein